MDILFLIIGLSLILGGASLLTDGSASLAQRFRIPEFIIGLTIVAVGTSTPELVVSTLSALAGNSDVAIGNVVGSNIFNTLIILGICALITPVLLSSENIRRDIPLGFAAAALLMGLILIPEGSHGISRTEGIAMLVIYIGAMWYTVRTASRPTVQAEVGIKYKAMWLTITMILIGLGGLIAGGELFLRSATSIARNLGVSESIIAITLIAGGTSLPELASSVVSLFKGKAEMALGNVIGSNIANILLILGLSATIHPLSLGGITPTDIGMVLLSSALLFVTAFTFRRQAIDRWEGAIFIAIYVGYIYYLLK